MKTDITIKIAAITKLIDELQNACVFKNEDNLEEYQCTIEDAVTSLEELQDIIDRDEEYAYYKELISKNENSNN
jgi:hypothetical protein